MRRTIRNRIDSDEKGFTLGQRSKGQDASAKSDARNMVSQVESCYTTSQDYSTCTNPANTGLAIDPTGTPASKSAQVGVQAGTDH
jgi:type IV pilus assembly protein PilA